MIKLSQFKGAIPKVSAKLLPDEYAETALNCDLAEGSLKAMAGVSNILDVSSSAQTIHRMLTSFLQWDAVVNVARSFVAGSNRIMYTGDSYPKETNSTLALTSSPYPTASRRLGIASPTTALTITLVGSAGTDVERTTSYVYTIVGKWADGTEVESGPSSPTAVTDVMDGITVRLTGFTDATETGVYTTHFRVYRLITAETGLSEYQYVDEFVKSTVTYDDEVSDADLGEVIPSTDWAAPITNLSGLTATSHGVMFGFYGNTIYPSEIFIPYAYPSTYSLTTESDIVGFGYTGSIVAVLTKTVPYVLSGYSPETLSLTRLGYHQSCVAARSIVNVPGGVVYASPDGLFLINESGAGSLLTKDLFKKTQWKAMTPANLFAFYYDECYVGFFAGTTAGFQLNLSTGQYQTITLTANVYGGEYSPADDLLYLITAKTGGRQVVSWQSGTTVDYTWKSKIFCAPSLRAYTAGVIHGDFTAGSVTFKLYTDGVLVSSQSITSDAIFRIPPVLGEQFQIQVSGKTSIDSITLGQSVSEVLA